MASPDEDHREKNILLAKNLNQVKMDLRCKKKDLLDLRTQLRAEKQRNSKLESGQMTILQRIDFLKQKLDDTFYKNTVGYINLSKQLDQMHHDSVQSFNDTSSSAGDLNATFSLNNNTVQTTFLDKIKAISEAIAQSDQTSDDTSAELNTRDTLNGPRLSSNCRQSLSFNTFSMGLTSTLADGSNENDDADASESVMNVTFLDDSSEDNGTNEVPTPLTESNRNRSNITLRRNRKKSRHEKASKMTKKMVRNHLLGDAENQPMATDSGKNANSDVMLLRRGCRPVKKIDYNETSLIRRRK